MAAIEAKLTFIKEDGKLIGFSVVAEPQTEAEYFCAKMPNALANQKADIDVAGSTITFTHPEEGSCSFEVDPEDAKTFKQFSENKGPYKGTKCGLHKAGFLTPGFKIALEGKEDSGEEGEPIRSNRH